MQASTLDFRTQAYNCVEESVQCHDEKSLSSASDQNRNSVVLTADLSAFSSIGVNLGRLSHVSFKLKCRRDFCFNETHTQSIFNFFSDNVRALPTLFNAASLSCRPKSFASGVLSLRSRTALSDLISA
jgi:hypothetical protein